ncbi:MAG: YceI family protein [Pseudomonadota bacterium]
MINRSFVLSLLSSALISFTAHAAADWDLDGPNSSLSFVSIKAGSIGEVHTFKELTGKVGSSGQATLTIPTASVDTLIPIRDDRMLQHLFQTALFPDMTVAVALPQKTLDSAANGGISRASIQGELTIKDRKTSVQADVLITGTGSDQILVTTTKPILLNAAVVGLDGGVEKLREIAGLPSISQAVPVIFTLTFSKTAD